MKRPKRMIYVNKVLDDWDRKGEFTAEQFADAYNERYGHYSLPSSGFYTYFLTLEKMGCIRINRSEDIRRHKYELLIKPKNYDEMQKKENTLEE